VPSHLMDSKRHDFKNIRTTGVADTEGDKAFDAEEFSEPQRPGLSVIDVTSRQA
jgi:tRNA 2-thiocytidine biosynthesis protein TtcA